MTRRMAIIAAGLSLITACGDTSTETTTAVPTTTMVATTTQVTTSIAAATTSEAITTTAATTTTTLGPDAVIDPGDGGNYAFDLTPADFVAVIDNPYLPFTVGSSWVYEGDGEHIEVSVLAETRVVMGITATVVRDTVSEDGEVTEDTYDWYAQDAAGNVWYLGEDTTTYQDGNPVSHEGSWEAGVDGALPGIVMPAMPVVGDVYRQEFYVGHAEDLAEVARIGDSVSTPYDDLTGLLVTTEWTPLSPDEVEEKYYAPGIGVVYETVVRGEPSEVLLTGFTPGG